MAGGFSGHFRRTTSVEPPRRTFSPARIAPRLNPDTAAITSHVIDQPLPIGHGGSIELGRWPASPSRSKDQAMTAYAIAHLRNVAMGAEIVEYLQRIDATLEPFGGRFLVHGGEVEVREGEWAGDLIMIEFPDLDRARAWYASAAYQDILRLRADNSEADVIFARGVSDGHRATDVLSG
jgi:uncharacterized protein (DUF1330 family)